MKAIPFDDAHDHAIESEFENDAQSLSAWLFIRDKVKTIELQAEKSLLEKLEQLALHGCERSVSPPLPQRSRLPLMLDNISCCLPQILENHQALAFIFHAVEQDMKYDDVFSIITQYSAS